MFPRFSSYLSYQSTSKMSSSASNEAYDMLIKLRDKLTCLNGDITQEAVNKLEDKLGGIFTMAKTHHYTQGQKYGHLASAIPKSKYRLVIGNATWTHTVPTNPGAYSAGALNAGNVAATHKQLMAQHKIKQKSYRDYLNVKEAQKELILYAVGDDAVAPLKKQYIHFGNTAVLAMINHLCLKTAIRMTTAQKYEYKTNGYNTPWDPTMSITAYFSLLDCFQVLLGDCEIATSNEEKTMAAGAQMWQSEMFTDDQMVVWENRGAMAQTWLALQTYFTEKWLERKQYLTTTAKQSQFKEAALLAPETAAAEEEGKTQALLFAMLQDQHAKQIAQMEAANKTNMDTMMEQINSLVVARVARHAHQPGKVNTPPGSNVIPLGSRTGDTKPRRKKALCPNCKCFVMHKLANCFELEANKASR
jgi:hypothetical protein